MSVNAPGMIKRIQLTIFLLLLFYGMPATSQPAPALEDGFYCVVGTFRFPNNALAYRQSLTAKGLPARIGKDVITGLYYVHLGKAPTKDNAITSAVSLRQKPEFYDAWVKTVGEQVTEAARIAEAGPIVVERPVAIQENIEKPPALRTEFEISNTEIFLHLYNATNDRLVDGTVEVIDTERSRLIEKTKGNSYYILPDPKSKSKRLTLIGDVFGYRKVQNEISYPIADADGSNPNIEMIGTITLVRFDMVRYVKGDVRVLYNVYFYHDASVMQPESKYELNKLLEMLMENERYRIRLHGHSNGNHAGKILLPSDDNNLFNIRNARETFGSAKLLGGQRAEVIRKFLIANGIAGHRIEIKSWGGKRPLYDKNGPNAIRNLRVEVEILEQ